MRQDMHVEMDDGTTYEISSDGRDIRAWEATYGRSWLVEEISFTNVAQLAYLAGQRTGVLNGAWPDYETFDAHCVEARGRRTAVTADPTRPSLTGDSSAVLPTDSAASRPLSKRKDRK